MSCSQADSAPKLVSRPSEGPGTPLCLQIKMDSKTCIKYLIHGRILEDKVLDLLTAVQIDLASNYHLGRSHTSNACLFFHCTMRKFLL